MASSGLLQTSRTRLLGVVFLVLCVAFVWFTYAVFTKQFASYDRVVLKANNIGLQLPALADVKIRGVIVGEVLSTDVTAEGVDVELGLFPDRKAEIPDNVTAEILPKTLFGEKFVSLVVPENPSPRALDSGDTIDRADVAIEVEQLLSDIYPLLRTVQPAQLNFTITAIATALDGRGDQIGEGIETFDDYLRRTNPLLPELIEDIRLLGSVSDTYRGVVPELARLLRNAVVTGETFTSQEDKIQALFNDVASFSSTSRDFLQANGDNIIRLADQGAEILPLFEKYAPQSQCFFEAMRNTIPRLDEAFRGGKLNIILELLPVQPRGYRADEKPVYREDAGPFPHCDLLDTALAGGFGQDNLPPDVIVRPMNDGIDYSVPLKRTAPGFDVSSGYAGTEAEKLIVSLIGARVTGQSVDDIPDIATALFGPMARGTEVNLR